MHMQQHWNPVHVSDTDLDTTRIVDYPCDECDSNIESDNGLKCHKGKKHKLTSGWWTLKKVKKAAELAKSNIISKNVLEELEEEEPPSLLEQNPNVYLCLNFKFIKFMCGRHESLN